MSIWKIREGTPLPLAPTNLAQQKMPEEHLEDWIAARPDILSEPLLIIGRQVLIPDVKDRLDLLALDPQGNAVIIELKRGTLKDPADIQALRYASYISKWDFDSFERTAREYLGRNQPDFNFNALFEDFCIEAGVEEIPELNNDQRIIVVGSELKEKLGSVAL